MTNTTEQHRASAHLDPRFGSTDPDGSFPRRVRHFGGETVLAEPPTRYVAISTGNLDGAVALGVIPIASTHNDSAGFVPDYLRAASYATPNDGLRGLDEMLDIGLRTAPDLGRITALQPTLITASYHGFGGRNPALLAACGPTVLPEGKGFNWKRDLLLLAAAFGRSGRAQLLLERYRTRVGEVAALHQAAGSPMISVARFGPLGLETHGTWSFCGSVLSDLGAHRPIAQSRHDNGTRQAPAGPSTTQIAGLDADLLFYTRVAVPGSQTAWRDAQRAGWSELPVVVGGRAHEADAARWHGHAGILAAFAVLDDIALRLQPAAGRLP